MEVLQITCHGAVNEIGGNKILLEDRGSALMLDFGRRMGAVNDYFDEFLQPRTNSCLRDLLALGLLPAIEGIYRRDFLTHAGAWGSLAASGLPDRARRLFVNDLPSYDDYAANGSTRLDGILLTHAHADHVQDLCFVDRRIPVYCTQVTRAILAAADVMGKGGFDSDVCCCRERHLDICSAKSTFPGEPKIETDGSEGARDFRVIEAHESFQVGRFEVEAIPVDHSVPGACAYLIKAPSGKVVFYTGDLRFHGRFSMPPTDLTSALRARVAGLRPDVLITEGTRVADSSGKITTAGDSEQDVERQITDIVSNCTGLAIIDFGWKDTTRFQTILNVAKATGRVLAVKPQVAYLWSLLREGDPEAYPDLAAASHVRVYLKRTDSMLYSLSDYSASKHLAGLCVDWGGTTTMRDAFVKGDETHLAKRLCHFRDGVRAYDIAADPRKYILHAGFFDMNELLDVSPPQGSVYVSASTEPFCDEMELDEKKLKKWLNHFGMIDTTEDVEHHHISGHANGEELLDFIRSAEPRLVIPIHTERPEVFKQEFGARCEVPGMGRSIDVY